MKLTGYMMFFLVMVSLTAFSQNEIVKRSPNHIFVEIGGGGGYGSANYERTLATRQKLSFALRAGISSYHIRDFYNKFNPDILIPLSLNTCFGKNHKIEIDLGQTIASIVLMDQEDLKITRQFDFHSFFSIGYRYQPDSGGLNFRCFYSPIIEYNRFYRNWAGISVGYSF